MVYAYPVNSVVGVVFREAYTDRHPRVFREHVLNGKRSWEWFDAAEFEEFELAGARMGTFDGMIMPRSYGWSGGVEFVAKPSL